MFCSLPSLNPSLPLQFGFDFNVHGSSINITSVLVFASNGTLATSKNVTIFDRSTDVALSRIDFDAGSAQQTVFVARAAGIVLRPGVYSILVNWTDVSRDRCSRGLPGNGTDVVQTTASVTGLSSSATRPGVTSVTSPTDLLGVTFRFSVIANQSPPPLLVATDFIDCEAVACAGLPTGEYSVQGRRTFCDNDEAGGGWTRIWRLNDSSCEENGLTSGRNVFANGTDPVGCRSGQDECNPTKEITLSRNNSSYGELMGKNWAIWSFGTPDSFATDDGVFVIAEGQRLWTFSVSHAGVRCPCNPAFGTNDTNILQRINDTGNDYICDAGVNNAVFNPVFQGSGTTLCSPRGNARRSFQKVLTEQQKRLPLRVTICKNGADSNEDIKISALDLFARQTPGFDKLGCRATTTSTPTTVVMSTTSTLATDSGAAQPTSATPPADSNVAVIAGAVGGSIGAVLLAAAIFFIVKRRRTRDRQTTTTAAAESNGSGGGKANYGQLPALTLVAPVSNYDVGNVTLPPDASIYAVGELEAPERVFER